MKLSKLMTKLFSVPKYWCWSNFDEPEENMHKPWFCCSRREFHDFDDFLVLLTWQNSEIYDLWVFIHDHQQLFEASQNMHLHKSIKLKCILNMNACYSQASWACIHIEHALMYAFTKPSIIKLSISSAKLIQGKLGLCFEMP